MELSRDLRLQAQTLRFIGWTYSKISDFLKVTLRQIQYACSMRATPQKLRCGRKATIDDVSRQFLVQFVCASMENRQLSYNLIPWKLGWDVSEDAIRLALKREGFSRRIASRKPPISKANRLLRLIWAHEHLNWTKEQWRTILWSDEIWVNGTRHKKIWVIRRAHEEYDPICIVSRLPEKDDWMFWSCFSDNTKELYVFWKKDRGKINKNSYCEHIIPVIQSWMRLILSLSFMQDNASGHAARFTKKKL